VTTESIEEPRPPSAEVRPPGLEPAESHPLDNVVWHALATSHRELAEGDGLARRYRPDVAPFHAVTTVDDQGWAALGDLAGPGGIVVLFRDAVPPAPLDWTRVAGGVGHQMVAEALTPIAPVPSRPLTDEDVPQMLELVALTQPGPFERRTIELGGYIGVFEGDRLLAMAGERMRVPGYTEVSAVCTHPDARGRGLAAALTHQVATTAQARGRSPAPHRRRRRRPDRHGVPRTARRQRR
jgi:GNAT superfamily N-acetyltransferase